MVGKDLWGGVCRNDDDEFEELIFTYEQAELLPGSAIEFTATAATAASSAPAAYAAQASIAGTESS